MKKGSHVHQYASTSVIDLAAVAYAHSDASGYKKIGSRREHVVRWTVHHGVRLDPKVWVIHHKNSDKQDNRTCRRPDGTCNVWDCGNLAALTRAEHIRQHRPGRMGGRRIPNRAPPRVYTCEQCGSVKSRNGTLCRVCRYV